MSEEIKECLKKIISHFESPHTRLLQGCKLAHREASKALYLLGSDPRLEAARELAKAGDALKVTMDEDAEICPPDWHKFTDALAAFKLADGGE